MNLVVTYCCFLVWLLGVQGCTDIVVKVGKKEKSRNLDVAAAVDNSELISVREIEFYLNNIDNLRNSSAEAFLQKIQKNWRRVFRREFRVLRDSLIEAGEREHKYYDGIFFDVSTEDCTELEKLDFRSFDGLEKMGNLLEGSFIVHLSYEQAQKLNPDLAQVLDVTTNVVLFELGMRANGWSEFTTEEGLENYRTKVLWKVDPEVGDLPEEKLHDDIGMELDFTRRAEHGAPKSLTLTLTAAAGLFEQQVTGPVYKLEVTGIWSESTLKGLSFENIIKISKDDELTYSRQFVLEQSHKFSPVYLFRDTVRYQLPDEQSRQVLIDFGALEKCALEHSRIMVPGVIGMDVPTADNTLKSFSFKMNVVEDRTGGTDPAATVSAQTPRAGTHAPAGSEVKVILDYPADDPFESPSSNDNGEEPPVGEQSDSTAG